MLGGTMVVGERRQGRLFGLQDVMGQVGIETLRSHSKRLVRSIEDPEHAIDLLSFIEFLFNVRQKTAAALDAYRKLLAEVARDPAAAPGGEIAKLQAMIDGLEKIRRGIHDFFLAPTEIDGLTVNFTWVQFRLLEDLPERFGIRLVVERWTAPPGAMGGEQKFEAVEFPVPARVKEKDFRLISVGSRTSLTEDAIRIQEGREEIERAAQASGLGIIVHIARVFFLAGRWLFARAAAKAAARTALMTFLRNATTNVTIRGVAKAVAVDAIILLGIEGATGILKAWAVAVRIPEQTLQFFSTAIDAANRIVGGVQESAVTAGKVFLVGGTLIVLGGVAYWFFG